MLRLQSTDQWGTYHVGECAFFSKLEAVMYSRHSGKPVTWQYMRDTFERYNWTQEPTQSLWELYSQRARQLREKYAYIMLMYSGGADSTNVLKVFESNNLHIDEIRMGYAGDISNVNSLSIEPNQEIYHAALPRVRELQKKWPNLKVTVVDMNPLMVKRVCEQTESLHYGTNSAWNPWQAVRFGISTLNDLDWLPKLNGDKSMAVLWGKDKTRITKAQGRYAVEFQDVDLHGNIEELPDNCKHEYFYWSPDSVPLIIKQGHVLKNFLSHSKDPQWFVDNKKFFSRHFDNRWTYNSIQLEGQTVFLNNGFYNTMVYPHYDPTIIDTGKAEWRGVGQVVRNAFYKDQNLRRSLADYMRQKFLDYTGYAAITDTGSISPMTCSDQPWFLEK